MARPRSKPKAITSLGDLTPDPKNARKHGPRNVGTIVDALHEVGAARSIVIDEHGVVLAGNATVEAAGEAGLRKVQVVDADGQTIIAVRRTGLNAHQKARLALYDNRSAELAEGWDAEVLRAMQADGVKVDDLFHPDEWADLCGDLEGRGGRTDEDAVVEARPTSIQLGEMFALGPHRLICGDATQRGVVERLLGTDAPTLMVTDPPYGVDYDPTWRRDVGLSKNTKKMGRVLNDDRADWTPAWALFPGGAAYVYHGALHAAEVQASLMASGFAIRAQIVWVKDRFVLSRGDYHWQHELCWYAVRKAGQSGWTGSRRQATIDTLAAPMRCQACGSVELREMVGEDVARATTVWKIKARDDHGHGHGTQKPVEAMARPMRNSSAVGGVVYDPFMGSGTTLIAGSKWDRKVLGVELDPVYVQMAIDRWEQFTGQKAVKVG